MSRVIRTRTQCSIIGADFSAQEPRSTASLANDEDMLNAYKEGKDLYAVIGSTCFDVPYENCLEFHPVTKVLQPDGKERRSMAKAILLGITYGMSANSLAGRINKTLPEAEAIIESFYKGFKGVKKLTEDSQKMLKEKGYVTDMWGRRRHIPDAQLPEYTIKPLKTVSFEFNPLIGSVPHEDKVLQAKILQYEEKLKNCKWKKDKDNVIAQAKKDGFTIVNNQGFISRALRQCLNARIQGTAASMTKYAMVMINNDEELNRLGFKLLATIHDEVFGEAPTENAEAAAKRLSQVMVSSANSKCVCPFKCDAYTVKAWYEDECTGNIRNDYNKLIKKGLSEDDAKLKILKEYEMFTAEGLKKVIDGNYEVNTDDISILKGI